MHRGTRGSRTCSARTIAERVGRQGLQVGQLDHSASCVNLRDVGEWITLIAGREYLPPRRLLRGGKLDGVRGADEIGRPGTIINLRLGPDPDGFDCDCRQIAIPNTHEKYDTTDRVVRRWLNEVAGAVESARAFPVLVHCTAGKDRTGVAVATLLRALDVPHDAIVAEYLLSDGGVDRRWIERALAGIGEVATYLDCVDLARLRHNLRGVS